MLEFKFILEKKIINDFLFEHKSRRKKPEKDAVPPYLLF